MKQKEVAGKILIELLELNIATEENEITLFTYLSQAYAAGYTEGALQHVKQRAVMKCKKDGTPIKIYESSAIAARKNNIARQSITRVCRGKYKHAGGFFWIYVDKYVKK